jgi:hypothetical protein
MSASINNQPKDNEKKRDGNKKVEKAPRIETITLRLVAEDNSRFIRLCAAEKRAKTDVIREAVRLYLDGREQNLVQERDEKLEKLIKKGFERIAALQARANIDIGVIYNMAWNNLPEANRKQIFTAAYGNSVKRLKQKLSDSEQAIQELIQQ